LCFQSMFRIHNETLSIWTHLLGFLYFFVMMFVTIFATIQHNKPKPVDFFVFVAFFIGAQCQMLFFSRVSHDGLLFRNSLQMACKIGLCRNQLDDCGVILSAYVLHICLLSRASNLLSCGYFVLWCRWNLCLLLSHIFNTSL